MQAEAEAGAPGAGRPGHGCNGAAAAQRHGAAGESPAPLCAKARGSFLERNCCRGDWHTGVTLGKPVYLGRLVPEAGGIDTFIFAQL